MYAICQVSVAPLRSEAADSSEMISQLLFGDRLEIIEKGNKDWIKVKSIYDDYEGWVDQKQLLKMESPMFNFYETQPMSTAKFDTIIDRDNLEQILYPGSELPNYHPEKKEFEALGFKFYKEIEKLKLNREELIKTAYKYINTPYLWGGKSLAGIDCSGFTQMVYKMHGIKLKRDAWQQAEQGELLNFFQEAKPGDLAFFDNEEGRIIHVGILLDNNEIIHAHGKIRIDKIDHSGIYNVENQKHSHKLRCVKTYL